MKLNYSKIITQSSNINTSLIFFLYKKNSNKLNFYYKINNTIQGYERDTVLKENIYISSNGLKKNVNFLKNFIPEGILCKSNLSFVSFFYFLEDNLFLHNIYPIKYYRTVVREFIKNQETVLNAKRKLKINERFLASKFLANEYLLSPEIKTSKIGKQTKLTLIKGLYHKLFFVTNKGFLAQLSYKFRDRSIFAGLTYRLKEPIKRYFKIKLVINYLLLKFFINNSLICNKNSQFLLNSMSYFYYWRYINKKFYVYLSQNKIRFRKANKFLIKYDKISKLKIRCTLKYYYYLTIHRYKYIQNSSRWLNWLLFNKENYIFNNKNIDSKKIDLQTIIKNLPSYKKSDILKVITNNLSYLFISTLLVYTPQLQYIKKYFIARIFILKFYTQKYIFKYKLYRLNKIRYNEYSLLYIQNFLFNKSQYTPHGNIFSNIKLQWYPFFNLSTNIISIRKKIRNVFFYPMIERNKPWLKYRRIYSKIKRYFLFYKQLSTILNKNYKILYKTRKIVRRLRMPRKMHYIRRRKKWKRRRRKILLKSRLKVYKIIKRTYNI